MAKFERHVFICVNEREAGHPRGCCSSKDGPALVEALKEGLKSRGLDGRIRGNKAQCLDQCEHGATMVVYPEQVWYGFVTTGDIEEIIESHLVNGKPVERLMLRDGCINTDHCPHRASGMMQLG